MALATIGVGLTTMVVAALGHSVIGLTVPFAILLGAIVAPTDPVSVTAILRKLGMPDRLLNLFEAESLFNDGTGVVVFTVAIAIAAGSVTDELLERMAAAEKADLVADYPLLLPLTLISEIIGVAERDRLRFRRWFSSLVAAGASGRTSLRLLFALPNVLAMMRFLRRLVAERRERPRDDLVSRLAGAGKDGDRLGENDLLAMVALLLLTYPDQLARLRQDPGLVGTAVKELLRLGSPVDVATERYAREDVEVAGVAIPRGSLVLVGIVSANTDGARFERPEHLDVARERNQHVAFGHGPHYCLGAPLARLEGRIAIGSLIRRFPDLRPAVRPDQLRWRQSVSLRGLVSLPVRY